MEFEFNLDEIDLGNSNGLEEFTFDQVGGSAEMKFPKMLIEIIQFEETLPGENALPGEELLNEPPSDVNVNENSGEEPAQEKLEIELVGDDNKPEASEKPLVADVNRVVSPVSKEQIDFTNL